MLTDLPPELIALILSRLDAASLCRVAVSTALAAASDAVARGHCARRGLHHKGSWCSLASWRVMNSGRHYKAGMEVRRDFLEASRYILEARRPPRVRTRSASRSAAKAAPERGPVAVAALPEGLFAVCFHRTRSVEVLDLSSGTTLLAVKIDGLPCGICTLSPQYESEYPYCVAVAVQGQSESGEPLAGVDNALHRIDILDLRVDKAGHPGILCPPSLRRWVPPYVANGRLPPLSAMGTPVACLSYPNGLCVVPAAFARWYHNYSVQKGPVLAVSNWNANTVTFVCAPRDHFDPSSAAAMAASTTATITSIPSAAGVAASAAASSAAASSAAASSDAGPPPPPPGLGLNPSASAPSNPLLELWEAEFALPDFVGHHLTLNYNRPSDCAFLLDETSLVVADYYGGCVWLYCCCVAPKKPGKLLPGRVLPSRKCRSQMQRPTSLAVDPTSGHLLVAEAGARLISVFSGRVKYPRANAPVGQRKPSLEHLCDICVGQLGTGLHKPLEGEWSWLGVRVTREGDVLVADCDCDAVYLV